MSPAVDVFFEERGDPEAPALVLSNSLGTTMAMWDPQVGALAERLRVVRYDHRGHGRSPVPPGPYDIADLGGDVVRLLDRLGIERAHLCGLSLGGMTAMWVAATAPERVGRLVLCCTSARLGPPDAWAARAAKVRACGSGSVADMVVARWFTPEFATAHPDVVARMRDMLASTPPEGYAACCGAIERMDLEPLLGRIRAHALVIAGGRDPAIPPSHAHRIGQLVPHCRVMVVEGAAHLVNVEQAGEVTRAVVSHLDQARSEEEP